MIKIQPEEADAAAKVSRKDIFEYDSKFELAERELQKRVGFFAEADLTDFAMNYLIANFRI